jgi:hypothetical protein
MRRRIREVTPGGDLDILSEVFMDGLLAGLLKTEWFSDFLKPVIDAPDIEGSMLA